MIRSLGRVLGLMLAAIVGLSQATVAISHAEAHHRERVHQLVSESSSVPHGPATAGHSDHHRTDLGRGPAVVSPGDDVTHQHAVIGQGVVARDGMPAAPAPSIPRSVAVAICRSERPALQWSMSGARAGPDCSNPAQPRAPPLA